MVDKVEIKNEMEKNISLEEQEKTQEKQEAQKTDEQVSETSEARPDWLPEKFANAQELAKAYSELEKKQSQPKEEEIADEVKTTEQLKINKEKVEKETNISLDNFYDEYAKTGNLSEKSYKDLAGKGLDKSLVDSYIAGQQALADKHVTSIHSVVGGQESYNNIVKWASETLTENEVQAFNQTMDNGTLDQAQLAISGIQAKYNAVNKEPSLFSGERADTSKGAYRSVGEMLTDINNPKYATDSAFRADVESKVKASNVL